MAPPGSSRTPRRAGRDRRPLLTGTRLRLRLTRSDHEVVRKLGQKVRRDIDSPEFVRLTTIYPSEQEYAVLAEVDASVLVKTR